MSYQTVTLDDCRARLALRYEGQPFWTADQARHAINEGLRIWNALTGTWKAGADLTTVPNDPHLYAGGAIFKPTRVSMGSRVLIMSSLNALDKGITNWEGVNTASGGTTPSRITFWCPVGLTEVMLYPKDAPPGQSSIRVEGVASTPILVNGSDYLNLGSEELSTLLGYALHVLSIAKGTTALQKTQPLRVAFYRAAAKRNAVFAASGLFGKMIGYDRTRDVKPLSDPDEEQAGKDTATQTAQNSDGAQ